MAFLSAKFNTDGTINVEVIETSVTHNGNYTLDIKVEENTNSGKTSVKTFTVTFSVTGLIETKNSDAKENIQDVKLSNTTVFVPKDSPKVTNHVNVNLKEQKVRPAPTLKSLSVNRFGLMEIVFSERLIPPENIKIINSTVLQIKVTAANLDLQSFMVFTWEA